MVSFSFPKYLASTAGKANINLRKNEPMGRLEQLWLIPHYCVFSLSAKTGYILTVEKSGRKGVMGIAELITIKPMYKSLFTLQFKNFHELRDVCKRYGFNVPIGSQAWKVVMV